MSMMTHRQYLGLGNCAERLVVLLNASAPSYFDSSSGSDVKVYDTAVVALPLWRESDMLIGECNMPTWGPSRNRPMEASSEMSPACGCGEGKLPASGGVTASLLG